MYFMRIVLRMSFCKYFIKRVGDWCKDVTLYRTFYESVERIEAFDRHHLSVYDEFQSLKWKWKRNLPAKLETVCHNLMADQVKRGSSEK